MSFARPYAHVLSFFFPSGSGRWADGSDQHFSLGQISVTRMLSCMKTTVTDMSTASSRIESVSSVGVWRGQPGPVKMDDPYPVAAGAGGN